MSDLRQQHRRPLAAETAQNVDLQAQVLASLQGKPCTLHLSTVYFVSNYQIHSLAAVETASARSNKYKQLYLREKRRESRSSHGGDSDPKSIPKPHGRYSLQEAMTLGDDTDCCNRIAVSSQCFSRFCSRGCLFPGPCPKEYYSCWM